MAYRVHRFGQGHHVHDWCCGRGVLSERVAAQARQCARAARTYRQRMVLGHAGGFHQLHFACRCAAFSGLHAAAKTSQNTIRRNGHHRLCRDQRRQNSPLSKFASLFGRDTVERCGVDSVCIDRSRLRRLSDAAHCRCLVLSDRTDQFVPCVAQAHLKCGAGRTLRGKPMQHVSEKKLWSKHFLALISSNLLLCLGVYMLPATLPASVAGIGGTPFQTGLVIGAFSIFSRLTRVASGVVIDVAGEKGIIWIGMVTMAISTFLMLWMPINGILFLRGLQGIGWGLATASIATVVYKIVPEAHRGEGAGYYSLTVIVPVSLSPLLAIVLMDYFEFQMVLAVSAVFTFAALVS